MHGFPINPTILMLLRMYKGDLPELVLISIEILATPRASNFFRFLPLLTATNTSLLLLFYIVFINAMILTLVFSRISALGTLMIIDLEFPLPEPTLLNSLFLIISPIYGILYPSILGIGLSIPLTTKKSCIIFFRVKILACFLWGRGLGYMHMLMC